MNLKKWMYREGRPNWLAKILNTGWAWIHSRGVAPDYLVTLEVPGRHSGKMIRFPLVMTVIDGEHYLVSMLGEGANWVRNVRAARGKAFLLHGISECVVLEEVEIEKRAPILKIYLAHAPGARPHIPVEMDAPLEEFEKVAGNFLVFRVIRDETINSSTI